MEFDENLFDSLAAGVARMDQSKAVDDKEKTDDSTSAVATAKMAQA